MCNLFGQDGEYKLWFINIEEGIFDILMASSIVWERVAATSILYSKRAEEYLKHFVQNFINRLSCINICNLKDVLAGSVMKEDDFLSVVNIYPSLGYYGVDDIISYCPD